MTVCPQNVLTADEFFLHRECKPHMLMEVSMGTIVPENGVPPPCNPDIVGHIDYFTDCVCCAVSRIDIGNPICLRQRDFPHGTTYLLCCLFPVGGFVSPFASVHPGAV